MRIFNQLLLPCMTIALAATCSTQVNAGFQNGSFEVGSAPGSFTTLNSSNPVQKVAISDWTVETGSIDYIGSYWGAQDGSRSLDLAGNGTPSTISQSFATTIGQVYRVEFWLSGNPDNNRMPNPKWLDALVDNTVVSTLSYTLTNLNTRTNMLWEQYAFDFTAIAVETKLSFRSANTPTTPYGAALDNVSVSAIPEPASLALFGMGAIGVAISRRRRVQSAV